MEERLLRIGEVAEILGVDVMTLRRWDEKGILVPQRTPNGHRRYTPKQVHEILEQNRVKEKKKIDEEEVKKIIRLFARSLIQLDLQVKNDKIYTIPMLWIYASAKLRHLSLQLEATPFPTTLNEQIKYWKLPLNEWEIPILKDIFDEKTYWLGEPVLYDGEITDFCYEIAASDNDPIHNEDLQGFLEILEETSQMKKFTDYSSVRKLIITNPTMDFDVDWFKVIKNISPSYRTAIKEMYQDIPKDYVNDGYIYLCPYCGWTLKRNNFGVWNCFTRQCRKKMNRLHKKWEPKKVEYHSGILRVKPGILRYIVIPGIPELRIYNSLEKLGVKGLEMYPGADEADILFQVPNGETWLVDVKDWGNVKSLTENINKGVFKTELKWDKGFVVIPSHFPDGYIQYLKLNTAIPNNIKIIGEKEFIRLVKNQVTQEVF